MYSFEQENLSIFEAEPMEKGRMKIEVRRGITSGLRSVMEDKLEAELVRTDGGPSIWQEDFWIWNIHLCMYNNIHLFLFQNNTSV